MSLYDGFNGFQIGSGLNALHQGMAARNGQVMQGLGNALDGFVQNLQAANREKARKKSALDYLLGNGYTQEQAQQVTDTVGPEIVGQHMQWNKQKEDLADERAYQEKLRKENFAREDLGRGADFTKGLLLQVLAKPDGILRSRREVERDNKILQMAKKFYDENPQYGVKWENIAAELGLGDGKEDTIDDYIDLIPRPDENGVTDLAKFDQLRKQLIESGRSDVLQDERFAPIWDLRVSMANGDPTTRDALMLGSGKTATEQDAAKKKAKEDFQRAVANAKNALEKEAQKSMGQGKLPEGLTKAVVKEILKDPIAKRRYRMLGGQI